MKIFFDTEFYENGKTIELISIGMVREDGSALYFEVEDGDSLCKSHWLKENVLLHLKGGTFEKPRSMIASTIVGFVGEKPEFWAYYADYDWVALCQLYGTMMDLPQSWPMFCMDIKQLAVMKGNPELPKQLAWTEHDALADAYHAKLMYEFLRDVEYPEWEK